MHAQSFFYKSANCRGFDMYLEEPADDDEGVDANPGDMPQWYQNVLPDLKKVHLKIPDTCVPGITTPGSQIYEQAVHVDL